MDVQESSSYEPPAAVQEVVRTSTTIATLPPEVLLLVFSYVGHSDLTKCARVCRQWNQIGTPIIWKILDASMFSGIFPYDYSQLKQGLARNAHHIRELQIASCVFLDYLFTRKIQSEMQPAIIISHLHYNLDSAIVTNLRRLSIKQLNCRYSPDRRVLTMMEAFLKCNPFLTTLEFHEGQDSALLAPLVLACPNLQELRIWDDTSPRTAKQILDCLPESIQTVSMRVNSTADKYRFITPLEIQEDPVQQALTATPRFHPNLESLWIDGHFLFYAEDLLLPFLETCGTKLREFSTPDTNCFLSKTLGTALIKAGMSMQRLIPGQLKQKCRSSDVEIANTISQHSPLFSIDLDRCTAASSRTATAILASPKCLRELIVSGCTQLSSTDLISILGTAENLCLFSAIGRHRRLSPWLLATDLTACEWKTPQLGIFSGWIKVPRARQDIAQGSVEETLDSPSVAYCHKVQRAVYRKIAMQTNLNTLGLGGSVILNSPFHWYSLEMTLESGLDELVSLKELNTLEVEFMNHKIGIPELEWMNEHWPKLRGIHGLFPNDRYEDSAVLKWLRTHERKWVVY